MENSNLNKKPFKILLNNDLWYVINPMALTMTRWENIFNKETKTKENINTDSFNFCFEVKLVVSEVDNSKFTKVTLFKGNSETIEFLDEKKDSANQLIKFLINNFCYLDESKKYIKDDMKNIYQKLREEASGNDNIEVLNVNGWKLDKKKYIKNSLSLFEQNFDDLENMKNVLKYFIENDEYVVISLVDKVFNLMPFNNFPFVRNIYGTMDTGKTTGDLISQSFLKYPEILNSITPASLENIRSRTKNYIITFDETHLKGQNPELVYNLANDMIDQKMKRSSGLDWESSKRTSSFITATLLGETQYVPTFGGEGNKLYYYEKKNKIFDSEEDKHQYEKMLNLYYVLQKSNYGIFFDEIITFLEENFDLIRDFFLDMKGNRRDKTILFYKYTYNLLKEFFLQRDIKIYDLTSHIDGYKEENIKTEDELKMNVVLKLEDILRKFNNKYIEVRNKNGVYESIGFVKRVKNENIIHIYRNNKNIDTLCKFFLIEESKVRALFSETFDKKTSAIDFNEKTQSVFKFSESEINNIKNNILNLNLDVEKIEDTKYNIPQHFNQLIEMSEEERETTILDNEARF